MTQLEAVEILTKLPHIDGFPYRRNRDVMDALGVAVKCMTSPKIKSSAAIDIIANKILPKCRDTWEHDALVLAIEALKEKQTNGNNDSIFTR